MPAVLIAAFSVAILAVPGIAGRYYVHGDWNIAHGFFILFFSINLLICWWEICLFVRSDHVETRTEYWRARRAATGRAPAAEFLFGNVPLARVFSPTTWADVWATYSQYDGSYADRRTYGYNVDIANGFVTPVPTLVLYAAYTIEFLPVLVAGLIGAVLFWQWFYVTSVYWVSFFVAGRHTRIDRRELLVYILGPNGFWVLGGLLGLYVSIRLIVDGDYGVLGF